MNDAIEPPTWIEEIQPKKVAYDDNGVTQAGPFGRSTIFGEIKAGRLIARKVGRRTIILHEDLMAWAKALPQRKRAAA